MDRPSKFSKSTDTASPGRSQSRRRHDQISPKRAYVPDISDIMTKYGDNKIPDTQDKQQLEKIYRAIEAEKRELTIKYENNDKQWTDLQRRVSLEDRFSERSDGSWGFRHETSSSLAKQQEELKAILAADETVTEHDPILRSMSKKLLTIVERKQDSTERLDNMGQLDNDISILQMDLECVSNAIQSSS